MTCKKQHGTRETERPTSSVLAILSHFIGSVKIQDDVLRASLLCETMHFVSSIFGDMVKILLLKKLNSWSRFWGFDVICPATDCTLDYSIAQIVLDCAVMALNVFITE